MQDGCARRFQGMILSNFSGWMGRRACLIGLWRIFSRGGFGVHEGWVLGWGREGKWGCKGENIKEGDHKGRPYHGRWNLPSGKENRFSHYFAAHQVIEGIGGAFEGVGGGDMGFEFALGEPGE